MRRWRPRARMASNEGAESLVCIRGLPVSRQGFVETTALVAEWIGRCDQCRYFSCVNAHSAEAANRDEAFMAALQAADLLVADGVGVILASRILGEAIKERTTGPGIFMEISRRLNHEGGRAVFYLGGSPNTLARIVARHEAEFPHLRVAGTYSPPYQATYAESELAAMVDMVNAARPDVLWVGLGAPKQEKWVYANRHRLRVPVCGPIGAMFDYFAGTVQMPPRWVDRAGLHWAYRLAQEPRRLWRRNLDSPLFIVRVLGERIRRELDSMFRSQRPGSR